MKRYHDDCIQLLLEQLEKAPVNQLPMYAEETAKVISSSYSKYFEKILRSREDVMDISRKKKRIEQVLKNLAAK